MMRKTLRLSVILVLPVMAALILSSIAFAHGAVLNPLSRIYNCWLENAESPDTLPCQNLVNMSGTQPIYDWTEVNQRAGGSVANSMAIIPDGQLCSAGREKYFGLDAARGDWPIHTFMTSGAPYTFRWSVTANHPTASFHFFITKPGFDINTPLKWSDLEKFAQFENPSLDSVSGLEFPVYQFPTTLPSRSGRHIIYIIWERHDSVEDFYSCSDVWFGTSPTPVPTTAPACTAPAWVSGQSYQAGAIVSYNNKEWEARWGNAEQPSTAPLSAAWKIRANCVSGGATPSGPTRTPTQVVVGPTATRTATPTTGVAATATRTATQGTGPTATRTRTPTAGPSATRTSTQSVVVSATPTTGSGGTCSPVTSTIAAPFAQNGAGTFCWQASNLGSNINSWNMTSLTINGANYTNLWAATGSLPAKIGGFWYISYNAGSFGHFEANP